MVGAFNRAGAFLGINMVFGIVLPQFLRFMNHLHWYDFDV